MKQILLALFLFGFYQVLLSQHLVSGTVRDENQVPIPYAKIYIKNNTEQKAIANDTGYYELRVMPGEYYLIFTAVGYEERESYTPVINKDIQKDFTLFTLSVKDLSDVDVVAKRGNPGREIMLKVVEKREQINMWNYAHNVKVAIKAAEKIEDDPKKKKKEKEEDPKKKKKQEQNTENTNNKDVVDPFEAERKKVMEELNKLNLVEIQIDRSFAPKNKVKEVRNAYTKRGNDRDLYYTTTVKSNFNFFENLLHLDDLHQSPVSSPISGPGILSYKYRLEQQYLENGQKIHKIKIIPRMSSTSTLTGYIYVIDSLWLIQKLELSMEKGNLLKYDYFTIQQEFDHPGDTMCVLKTQNLIYGMTYENKKSNFKTEAHFLDYDFKVKFPSKYFSNEVAVTNQEAYERDTAYWSKNRVISLTEEEKRFIIMKDSIHERLNRKEYLDSIDAVFNKITIWKVLWFGVDHRNRPKQTQWTINSVAGTVRPFYVTGPRVAPGFSFYKKWKNQKFIDYYGDASFGLVDHTVFTQNWLRYRYNPFKYADFSLSLRNDVDVMRNYDAISQIINPNNFFAVTAVDIDHDFEVFNGFFLNTELNFCERRSLAGSKFLGFLDSTEVNNDFADFETYQALVANVTFSYTPFQKYMREPYRKVILGSKWPTLYVRYEKGIYDFLGSDVDHDYVLFGLYQSFQIKTLGTTNYHIKSGQFLNSNRLYEPDYKYHRRSDPWWFSNPLYSFQDLKANLPSRKIFFEGHFIHHDNGAIINKIPYMKKLNLGLVFGGGGLYVKEFDCFHSEIFGGIERNFKFSKRRLRLGIYGVYSLGNAADISPTNPVHGATKSTFAWKFSFAVLDDRNMKFNF